VKRYARQPLPSFWSWLVSQRFARWLGLGEPLGTTARTAKNWEDGKRKEWPVYLLKRLSKEHFIPFWWMGYGNRPEEKELAPDVEEPRTEQAAS
jgi:hypothetical protein